MAKGLRLTPRQQEVLPMLLKGMKLHTIAASCSPPISINVVKKHAKKVYEKVDDETRCAIWRARYWAR